MSKVPEYDDSKEVLSADVTVEPVDDALAARHLFKYQDGERLKRKTDLRLLSILACCYLLKNIDQSLVSYVLTINKGKPSNILAQLGMTSDQYAYANTVFTVFFIIAEIPSNLMIKWATPRLHFVRIITLWSITCACTAAVTNMAGLLALRGLLGLFEGGLWPGILFQLTAWYRPDEIAVRATALITLAQFAGIIDAFLTYGVSLIDGRGMAGWQWAFVITGLLGLVLATVVFFCLPDWPDSPPSRRQFLSADEAAFMVARLPPNASKSTDKNFDWQAIKRDLSGGLIWSFAGIMMLAQVGTTGLTFWLPTIVQSFGISGRNTSVLLTIPSAVLYILVSVSFGYYLDRQSRIPKPVFMIGAQVVMIGVFIGMIVCTSKPGLFALIILAYMPFAIYQTCIIPLRAMTTKGASSAAFAYAFQNVFGNSVNLYSAQIFRSKYAPRYAVPYAVCIAFFAASIGSVLSMWYFCSDVEKQTRMINRERRAAGKEGVMIEADVEVSKG